MKRSDIPTVKVKLLKKQQGLCLICKRDLTLLPSRNACLDHNHSSWMVRGVLCRQCNVLEAKYFRAFVRSGARNQGVDYKELLKGLIRFLKVKDTKYRYPPKPKRRKKNKTKGKRK
jgi:hypothetical protein